MEQVAEIGVNSPIIRLGRREGQGMLPVVDAGAVTMPGKSTSVILTADYAHSFVTVPGMIAPSRNWIVQINNRNLFDVSRGRFVRRMTGDLIAYDTGVDD